MKNIKKNKPSGKSKYRQGYYILNNPEKYIGDPSKIIYRSSWEYRFCKYCDDSENVIKWSSEPVGIKYISPIDQKEHDYFIDFYLKIRKGNGEVEYLVEVKPEASLAKPVMESGSQTINRIKNYNHNLKTWIINRAKFIAAKKYAEIKGYKFAIITEKFLFENHEY
jgi:hypothetical protein